MVRAQVQFTKEQQDALHRLAAETGRSVADLVREGVDQMLSQKPVLSRRARMAEALSVAGRFGSGKRDISEKHDEYLDEAYL
jgi:hypothetical protein